MMDTEPGSSHAKLPVPSLDWVYIRSTEERIATLHLNGGTLRTKLLELVDAANNLGSDWYCGTRASHVTQQKRQELATHIRKLETEEDQNQESVQQLERDLREHWTAYAAFYCREFCDRIRERLPKEVQLMVFEALWHDAHHTITDWNAQVLGTTPDDPVPLVESWSKRDTAHCFEVRFVGRDWRPEIIDAWWRMSVFQFKSFALIPKLLSTDFWGENIKDKVRKVIVDLSYREHRKPGTLRPTGEIKTSVTGADLDSELRHLFHFNHISTIKLSIKKRNIAKVRCSSQVKQLEFLNAAQRLFPSLERLQEDGYNLSVIVDKHIEIMIGDSAITIGEWRKKICDAVKVSVHRREWYSLSYRTDS
ncbi:hypothetical protein BU23DRAFT_12761 [Bimuria novae-zelandiae CBS 107.79]|uniref:Uncharacterized protein n=1 Tax=Bimuria novae-zelandiae CBS 107.79 TaxID=1447943 RepID=A0A6A5VUA1_9PLEO|nr:hypothetical protein BU23DRAFT_12761 [Bimuria novae-zelandiae CBS 107.79]